MNSLMDIYDFAVDFLLLIRDTLGRLVDWLTTPLISASSTGAFSKVWDALVSFGNLLGFDIPNEIVPIYLLFGAGIVVLLSVGLVSFFTNIIS